MDALRAATRDVFHIEAVRSAPLHGGDLSEVTRLTLADGRIVVAKRGAMVAREARMLAAIEGAGVPVPDVLGLSGPVLFLDSLDEVAPGPGHWARFGEDLARLHAHNGASYGWQEDYAFGPVVIENAPAGDWPGFWAEHRLASFLPHLSAELAHRIEGLVRNLPEILPATPPPSLLHGDLWTGNLLATRRAIHLIDPACYHGHSEVDLAMLHLFGSPGPGFAESYGALAPGWQRRRAVYSLFPALVHLRLFGAGYRGMVERFLTAAGG